MASTSRATPRDVACCQTPGTPHMCSDLRNLSLSPAGVVRSDEAALMRGLTRRASGPQPSSEPQALTPGMLLKPRRMPWNTRGYELLEDDSDSNSEKSEMLPAPGAIASACEEVPLFPQAPKSVQPTVEPSSPQTPLPAKTRPVWPPVDKMPSSWERVDGSPSQSESSRPLRLKTSSAAPVETAQESSVIGASAHSEWPPAVEPSVPKSSSSSNAPPPAAAWASAICQSSGSRCCASGAAAVGIPRAPLWQLPEVSGGDSFQDRKGVLGAPPESVNAPCASQPAPDPKLTPAVPLNPFELSTAQLRKVAEALEQRMEGASRPPRDSGRQGLGRVSAPAACRTPPVPFSHQPVQGSPVELCAVPMTHPAATSSSSFRPIPPDPRGESQAPSERSRNESEQRQAPTASEEVFFGGIQRNELPPERRPPSVRRATHAKKTSRSRSASTHAIAFDVQHGGESLARTARQRALSPAVHAAGSPMKGHAHPVQPGAVPQQGQPSQSTDKHRASMVDVGKGPLVPRHPVAQKPPPEYVPPEGNDCGHAEWLVDTADFQLEELIGTGTTAEVFRGTWHGTEVAVKKLRHSGPLSVEFARELSVLLRLRHPNLVLFMGASRQSPAMIISEFCAGGTIFSLLHQRTELCLRWAQRLRIAVDVAKGMNFLHHRQVIHRDLKSLNLLLAAPVGSATVPSVKISDFGLSRGLPEPKSQACMTSGAGTYHWMAPEVLSGQGYDEKIDVYSYGICLFELISRRIPFDGSGLEPVAIAVAVSKGRRPDLGQVPRDCPPDLRFTMECCWAQSPTGRPGFDTIHETLKLVQCR